jgi:phosphonate transport system substrate-binding protein
MTSPRCLVLISFFTLVLPAMAQAQVELIIGIFPRHNYTETFRMYNPMAKYLERHLHRKVRLETARDFNIFWANVSRGRYDLVHFNQYHYLVANNKYNYRILLKNEELGSATISSIIMVRKDSGINRLHELKGKRVIFGGDKTAMMSYLIPKKMLLDAGLQATDYTSEFARNPPNALMAVYLGRAEACGLGDVIPRLKSMTQRINVDELKIIAQSPKYPHLAWAINKRVNEQLKNKIERLLLDLNTTPSGKHILKRAKMTGLRQATHDEYKPLLKYME